MDRFDGCVGDAASRLKYMMQFLAPWESGGSGDCSRVGTMGHTPAFRLAEALDQEMMMAEQFDPAPTDKHASDPKRDIRRDKAKDDELQKGLKDSFPASDPVSSTQASKATPDA